MKNLLFFLLMIICFSCQNKPQITESYLGSYSRDTLFVKPEQECWLDTPHYDITDLIPLDLPSSYSDIDFHQIKVTKERIYVLDQKFNKTLFVFDRKGQFLFRMGKFGHARDEFIDYPTYFDVDKSSGDTYIYECNSSRILVFNNIGEYIKTIRIKGNLNPSSLVRMDDGRFLMAYSNPHVDISMIALSLHDDSLNLIKPLMNYTDEKRGRGLSWFDNTFFHDTRIAYTPFGADSVILFSGDKVEKVLKIDFNGCYIPEETMDQACSEGTWEPIFMHEGTQFIDACEVTDSMIHIRYSFSKNRCNYIHYFSDKRSYNSQCENFLKQINMGFLSSVYEDKLVYSLSADDVKLTKKIYQSYPKDIQTQLLRDAGTLYGKMLQGEISGPALMMVKLK